MVWRPFPPAPSPLNSDAAPALLCRSSVLGLPPAARPLAEAAPFSAAAAAAVPAAMPPCSGLGSVERPMRPSLLAAAAREARMDLTPRMPCWAWQAVIG